MATQTYRLTFVLLLAGSGLSTMQQTVAIIANSTDEAVKLAHFCRGDLPSAAIVSVTLTDTAGTVVWSGEDGTPPDVARPGKERA